MAFLTANYSPAYASNQYRALQSFFSWLNEEEEIANPMSGMKPPAVPTKLVPVLADGEQVPKPGCRDLTRLVSGAAAS